MLTRSARKYNQKRRDRWFTRQRMPSRYVSTPVSVEAYDSISLLCQSSAGFWLPLVTLKIEGERLERMRRIYSEPFVFRISRC